MKSFIRIRRRQRDLFLPARRESIIRRPGGKDDFNFFKTAKLNVAVKGL